MVQSNPVRDILLYNGAPNDHKWGCAIVMSPIDYSWDITSPTHYSWGMNVMEIKNKCNLLRFFKEPFKKVLWLKEPLGFYIEDKIKEP